MRAFISVTKGMPTCNGTKDGCRELHVNELDILAEAVDGDASIDGSMERKRSTPKVSFSVSALSLGAYLETTSSNAL